MLGIFGCPASVLNTNSSLMDLLPMSFTLINGIILTWLVRMLLILVVICCIRLRDTNGWSWLLNCRVERLILIYMPCMLISHQQLRRWLIRGGFSHLVSILHAAIVMLSSFLADYRGGRINIHGSNIILLISVALLLTATTCLFLCYSD